MTQLRELAKRFPKELVKPAPKGKFGDYVPHSTINERLLAVLGPFSFQVTEIVRGDSGKVEGVLATLTTTIDGRDIQITEVGDCENPDNWKTDGARLKDAASDALKRCASRIGCGLFLWSGGDYRLDSWMKEQEEKEAAGIEVGIVSHETPPAPVEKLKDTVTHHLPRVKAIKRRIADLPESETERYNEWFSEHVQGHDTTKWSKDTLQAIEVKLTQLEGESELL